MLYLVYDSNNNDEWNVFVMTVASRPTDVLFNGAHAVNDETTLRALIIIG